MLDKDRNRYENICKAIIWDDNCTYAFWPMFNRMNTYCFLYLARSFKNLRDWVEPVFILLFWITVINNITENPVCGIKAIDAFLLFWNTI